MIEVHRKLVGPGFGLYVEELEGVRLGKIVQALKAHMPGIPSATISSEEQLELRRQLHVVGLVPHAVAATSSLVSQAEMFRAADSKAAAKVAKKVKQTKNRGKKKHR
jgi:hypothetical protein